MLAKKTDSPKAGRPDMPKGYGISKGLAGALPWSFLQERIAKERNYWLATSRPDGRPHVMPIWGVWLDDAFCFGTDPNSVKGHNLAKNPHAVVHLESGDDVVVMEGIVDRVKSGPSVKRYVDMYNAKCKIKPGNSYHRLKPGLVLAWLEKDFPKTATRWKF